MTFKKFLTYIVLPIFIITVVPAGYYGTRKLYNLYLFKKTHSEVEETQVSTSPSLLVSEINLEVDFFSQAPYADWGMPFQEACEEASLILAYNYVAGITMSKEEFNQELLDLIDWETEYFGSYEHTTIEQTAEMLEQFYGFTDWEIIEDPVADDLKSQLSAGNPIVAPFAGRMLGNPNFTGEGPYYHMLVIKGYDETYFITNDVGTRLGHNYQYTYDVLMDALHDWHDEDITLGEKTILVLTKQNQED